MPLPPLRLHRNTRAIEATTRRAAMAIRFATVLLTAWAGIAAACITPERARELAKTHPDPGFAAAAAGHSHPTRTIAYTMAEPTACSNGKADIFPCANVDLLGHVGLSALGGGSGNDSWGWADPRTGREYALVGRSTGVTFVDVTEPTAPRVVGRIPRNAVPTVWADVKVFADHAFIVADNVTGVGLQVFDLRRLRDAGPGVTEFQPDTVYREFDAAHNVAINTETGFAYAVGGDTCFSGAHMVDINDPLNPKFAGCINQLGFIHDMQCLVYQGPDTEHRGKEICIANAGERTGIIDVSNKSQTKVLSSSSYPLALFSHQGWITEDHRYFVMGDEMDESDRDLNTRTIVLDLTDLDSARFSAAFNAATEAIDHNQYVRGNLLYQANYAAGLRILRIDDAATAELTEVAFFDSFPEGDFSGFQGAWNVYPFLPSGNVLISDFNRGLFIVRPTVDDRGGAVEIDSRAIDGQWVAADPDFIGAGEGLTFDVLDFAGQLFIAWFTWPAEAVAPADGPATDVGSPDNRWLTGQLEISGNSASGDLFVTIGGGFDRAATPFQQTERVGSMSIEFEACDAATVSYSIDAPGLSRTFEIIPLEKRLDPAGFACDDPAPAGPGPTDVR